MQVSGHRTRSIFDRYHIVSQSDIASGMEKLEMSQQEARVKTGSREEEFYQSSDRVAPKSTEKSATGVSHALPVALLN